MHGEVPKPQLKATPQSRWRRGLTILIVLAAVVAALAYVFFGMNAPQQRIGGRAARFAATGPVPVLVATALIEGNLREQIRRSGVTIGLPVQV